ncbi:hypothetical protein QA641_38130 [Bradyrhizobium sp. CB1650]|uniref:hypothetical protein n=1 Tax=Bradyrhizobium sp. CB1650 TaxID=3039153 RepID=UPI002434857E|nr:hypothetical protein [Bradyrhizobium sp. CB1650]WGD51245.1 hypothetical protein QA641_38130 [Bradyrhizobium sp. CB1650]
MANNEIAFEIDDNNTVDQNISALAAALKRIDNPLADVLSGALAKLGLEIAVDQGGAPRCVVRSDCAGATASDLPSGKHYPMSGWYLQKVSIEGFRGINNEGPLVVKLKPDCVSCISAPNTPARRPRSGRARLVLRIDNGSCR